MSVDIGLLATLISSLTVIFSAFAFCYKAIRKIDLLREDFNENTLLTYKLVIMSDKIPLDEKLEAGYKYINLGGNGAIKEYIHDLEKKQYNEMFKKEEDK